MLQVSHLVSLDIHYLPNAGASFTTLVSVHSLQI